MTDDVADVLDKVRYILKDVNHWYRRTAIQYVKDGWKVFFRDIRDTQSCSIVTRDVIDIINTKIEYSGLVGKCIDSPTVFGTYNIVVKVLDDHSSMEYDHE